MRFPLWKRVIDLSFAVGVGLVTMPLCLLAAGLIWFEDRSSPLFRQERVGEGGSTFTIFKLRTMKPDMPSVPSGQVVDGITRVGRIVRRLNIDELPQLVCVIRGEMSLVGPRPCLPSQTELMSYRNDSGASACRPGLTGLAQIRSYDGMSVETKAGHDAEYASKFGLVQDFKILLGTPAYFLKPPPAY